MFLCHDCPRNCNVDRINKYGFCSCGINPFVTRAAPHFGEEPCISGSRGSGAIFFSGCNLKCSFCQNYEISRKQTGKQVTEYELSEIMKKLEDQGVHNINLVTPTHYTRIIVKSLEIAKLNIPVVWNSSAYEKVETLKLLDGLVQVYMPDYKYSNNAIAKKYSYAEDYPDIAANAIQEMYRQRGSYIFDDGMLKSGVLIRHLILPGYIENSMGVIDYVADNFNEDEVLFSLMSQFTPMPSCDIKETISISDNENLIHYMKMRGLTGFCQELTSASEQFIPKFDLTGV